MSGVEEGSWRERHRADPCGISQLFQAASSYFGDQAERQRRNEGPTAAPCPRCRCQGTGAGGIQPNLRVLEVLASSLWREISLSPNLYNSSRGESRNQLHCDICEHFLGQTSSEFGLSDGWQTGTESDAGFSEELRLHFEVWISWSENLPARFCPQHDIY